MSERIDIFISSLGGGGAERVCVTIVNGLINLGYDVRLVVLGLKDNDYKKHLNDKVTFKNLNKNHSRKAIFSIYKYCKKECPQKILVFNHQLAIILMILKFFMRNELKVVSRNINTLSMKSKKEKSLWHKYIVNIIIKKLYKNVDMVIAQSIGMKEDLVSNYNFPKEKVVVINNPVNQIFEEKTNLKLETISESQNGKEILFVGRLVEQKGLSYLIEAFQMSLKTIPDLTLRIVGDGPLESSLKKEIKKLGMEDSVIFTGFSNDIKRYYLNTNLTVLSSLFEGFPNVLIESISLGTPVVAFDCPSGPSEIIIDDINGYLSEYLNTTDLSTKINKALNKTWDINKIKESGRRFSSEYVVKKYAKELGRV
ncbi:glycosyltransferase [Amphibacillus cookii]|uniref:glycosyltransferase n=1 Tax=Amphibacillus cookii TaxID=767787 RepID=UPI001955F781|nr:glycosyltransferase [Amphibacillus cookii]MBM7539781.1 glycosyltransferase involved in cell wall biosynthesis [Amphibacillus cookii]